MELTYFKGSRVEKEDWARTEMMTEKASCWEMSWEMVAGTPVIPDNPMDQDSKQVSWTLRGDITTTRVSVKKIVM